MKHLKEFFGFEVGPDGELIGFNDFDFADKGETDSITITYYLNDDERSVDKRKVIIENPTLDKIKDTLQELEYEFEQKGLWLDSKFEFEDQLWSYNGGMVIPASDDYIGGELAAVDSD